MVRAIINALAALGIVGGIAYGVATGTKRENFVNDCARSGMRTVDECATVWE